MIVWACGGCRKINKRNLARAMLILTAISLVLGLILGLAMRSMITSALEKLGPSSSVITPGYTDTAQEDDSEAADVLSALGLLAGLGTDTQADDTGAAASSGNSDLEGLNNLAALLEGLETLSGAQDPDTDPESGGNGSFDDLLSDIDRINQDAEAANDGWPQTLRPYPGGTAEAIASYRTEISDTTAEQMHEWIEDLKNDGFRFQDFYDFGMTEDDMLDMDAWWATDGEIYLSVSFYDGIVTIDHTYDLPDLSSYF